MGNGGNAFLSGLAGLLGLAKLVGQVVNTLWIAYISAKNIYPCTTIPLHAALLHFIRTIHPLAPKAPSNRLPKARYHQESSEAWYSKEDLPHLMILGH